MIAIKGIEKQTDCKKCPLMGTDGDPKDPLSPMMCIAIWATKREIKHCVEGKILDDCPLVDIITCGECNHCDQDIVKGKKFLWCDREDFATSEDCYCGDGERRE